MWTRWQHSRLPLRRAAHLTRWRHLRLPLSRPSLHPVPHPARLARPRPSTSSKPSNVLGQTRRRPAAKLRPAQPHLRVHWSLPPLVGPPRKAACSHYPPRRLLRTRWSRHTKTLTRWRGYSCGRAGRCMCGCRDRPQPRATTRNHGPRVGEGSRRGLRRSTTRSRSCIEFFVLIY